jgi:hypothetical protein
VFLWKKYVDENRRKKKLKEFLIGRRIICDIGNNYQEDLQFNHFKLVKCDIVCNLKEERWRKFKFKFRRDAIKCNQYEAFKEVLKIGRK